MVQIATGMIYNPGMRKRACAVLFMLSIFLPGTVSAGILITEIMYDPEGSDAKQEWIELYNPGPEAVNLADWKYADKSNHALNLPPKNGGLGTMLIAPGRYVILASDATTFVGSHPGISIVIDTTMILNNSGMTLGLRDGVTPKAVATYVKSMGAAGNGESLQWRDGKWIHAQPTPGAENAADSSSDLTAMRGTTETSITTESNNPLAVVNATATTVTQTAAAGSVAKSFVISSWWFAATAFAVGTGVAAAYISRAKKTEWDIVEADE
jgi:hypothetical protein